MMENYLRQTALLNAPESDRITPRSSEVSTVQNPYSILHIGENISDQHHIKLGSHVLEEVESFTYLVSKIRLSAKADIEMDIRLKKASAVYQM